MHRELLGTSVVLVDSLCPWNDIRHRHGHPLQLDTYIYHEGALEVHSGLVEHHELDHGLWQKNTMD